jgi:hypothetical protein
MQCDDTVRFSNAQGVSAVTVLCLFALPFLAESVSAQRIQGRVVEGESENRKPLAAVAVEARKQTGEHVASALTDSVGLFSLVVDGAGTYLLQATHPAFAVHRSDTVTVGADETVVVELRMDRHVILLDPLVVTARRSTRISEFDARREGGGFGRFITRSQIDERSPSRTSDLLRMIPGVTVTPERRGSGSRLLMRGVGGQCQPSIWIDGQRIAQFPGSTTLDEVLAPSTIEGVEIYTAVSTAPVQYRAGTCGVLLFWTRRGGGDGSGRLHWKRLLLGFGAAVALILVFK